LREIIWRPSACVAISDATASKFELLA
jgi:hypothetical protein